MINNTPNPLPLANYKLPLTSKKGFTLLELLIVITIIAILSVALIIVINPAETLKKARDTQRLSDLSTLKVAIGIYSTTVSPVYLGALASNAACQTTRGTNDASSATKMFYSYSTTITDTAFAADSQGPPVSMGLGTQSASSVLGNADGTGWIKINFGNVTGGSPISNLPIDPTNTITTLGTVASTDLVYRYACAQDLTYEIDATLESTAYTVTDDKRSKDGGNNTSYYESGTGLNIIGTGTDF